ncbi:MAG TPA: ATP-binding protein [Thermoleophilaceae bacterium]
MTGDRRELWLPAEPTSAALARRAIRVAATEAGLNPTEIADVVLATSEAVANAIEHGSPRSGDMIRVRVGLTSRALTVEVHDCGTFPAPARSDDRDRGRGLPIIGMLSDRVEVVPRPDGTTLRFAKHLGAPVADGREASFRAA